MVRKDSFFFEIPQPVGVGIPVYRNLFKPRQILQGREILYVRALEKIQVPVGFSIVLYKVLQTGLIHSTDFQNLRVLAGGHLEIYIVRCHTAFVKLSPTEILRFGQIQ